MPMSAPAATEKPIRLTGMDLFKGLLLVKLTLNHATQFFDLPALQRIVSLTGGLTFLALMFCFGLGTGLSTRRKPWWPVGVLFAAYFLGGVLMLGAVEARPLGEALATVLSFSEDVPFVDFLPAYIAVFLWVALLQRVPGMTHSRVGVVTLGASALLYVASHWLYRDYAGPLAPLWNGPFAAARSAILFGLGYVSAGLYRRYGPSLSPWPWAAVGVGGVLAVAAFDLRLHAWIPAFEYAPRIPSPLAVATGVAWTVVFLLALEPSSRVAGFMKAFGWLRLIGRSSIWVMFAQVVAMPLFLLALTPWVAEPGRVVLALAGTALCVACGVLVYRALFERRRSVPAGRAIA